MIYMCVCPLLYHLSTLKRPYYLCDPVTRMDDGIGDDVCVIYYVMIYMCVLVSLMYRCKSYFETSDNHLLSM